MKLPYTLFILSNKKGEDFVTKLNEEKSRSNKEWKVVQSQLTNVQDEKKGIRGFETTIRATMLN